MSDEQFLENGNKHFFTGKTLEELVNELCDEKSEFHLDNPVSLKKNITQATIKRAFQVINRNK